MELQCYLPHYYYYYGHIIHMRGYSVGIYRENGGWGILLLGNLLCVIVTVIR